MNRRAGPGDDSYHLCSAPLSFLGIFTPSIIEGKNIKRLSAYSVVRI